MGTLFLRRLTRWQAETEREQIADLRIAAHQESHPQGAPPDRAGLLRQFIDQDIQRPDFDLVLAGDPQPAGCAYGFRVEREDSWWSGFGERPDALPALAEHRVVFVVAALLVHPRRRGQGLAGRLQRELLSRAAAPLALSLIAPDNGPAQAAAQALGWSKAGQLTPRDGVPLGAWTVPLGHPG